MYILSLSTEEEKLKDFNGWIKSYPNGTRISYNYTGRWLPGKVTGASTIDGEPALSFLLDGEDPNSVARLLTYEHRKLLRKLK